MRTQFSGKEPSDQKAKEPADRKGKEPADHIAVFPPSTYKTCNLESWSVARIDSSCKAIVAEKPRASPAFCADQEDPERWDGMS